MFDAGAVVSRMELGLSGWKKSVEEVKKDQQSLAGFAMRHKEEIEKLGKAFTIVGGAIVASLGAAVIKTANYGDALNDMSERTGVSTEILSGYKLAADNSGTSIEGLASGLKLLSRNMFDAATGTGEAKAAFDFLGISVVNADGTLRDSNEVMLDVADRFKGMENGAQKTALSMDIFGKSGADLIPMLNMGRDGLKEAYGQAERFGMIVSKEAAKAADEFNDSLGNMKSALSGAGRTLGEALMPSIQGAVEKITSVVAKVREWASEHPELTRVLTLATGAVGGLMLGLGPLLITLPKVVQGWQTLTAVLHTSTAALATTLAGLTALVGGAVMVYSSINTMIKAKEDSVEADFAMAQSNTDVGKKLRDMADASGVSRAELIKLTDAYGGNNTKLLQAINQGKDQNETLQKLHGWVIKHREEVKKQEDALSNLAAKIQASVNPALATLKTKEEAIVTVAETGLGPIRDLGGMIEQIGETALPAARNVDDLGRAIGVLPTPDIKTDQFAKDTTDMSSRWDDMVRDITQNWAEGIQGLVEGTTSFKDFLSTTWGTVKQAFFRMIADMVTQWITRGITNMVSSAAEGAAAVSGSMAGIGTTVSTMASTVGGIIGGLASAIATAIGTIATGIATALVTLAAAIATAITTLAAVAPALLEIGLVAATVYTAFKLGESLVGAIGNLIGGGGGDTEQTIGYWGDAINKTIIAYGIALGDHIIQIKDQRFGEVKDKIDNLALSQNMTRDTLAKWGGKTVDSIALWGGRIAEKVALVASTIANLSGAASGAVSTSTQLMMIHGTPAEPEYVVPNRDRFAFAEAVGQASSAPAESGASIILNVNSPLITTSGLSKRDVQEAGEYLWQTIEFEAKRRGMRLSNA